MAAGKLDEFWSHIWMTDPDLIEYSLLESRYGSFAGNTQLDASNAVSSLFDCLRPQKPMSCIRVLVSQRALKPPRTGSVLICSNSLAKYTRADALSYRNNFIIKSKGLIKSIWFDVTLYFYQHWR